VDNDGAMDDIDDDWPDCCNDRLANDVDNEVMYDGGGGNVIMLLLTAL
jgi:hypothetical protein